MEKMKIGDLVKYVFNTENTKIMGTGIIVDSGKRNNDAPKNIHGLDAEVYYVHWPREGYFVKSGWYPSTCLEVISRSE